MISTSANAFVSASAAAMVAVAVIAAPEARAAGKFDGVWRVAGTTRAGSCKLYRANARIENGVISQLGGQSARMGGHVSPSGAVQVTYTAGPNHLVGSGRLSANAGSGRWHGRGPKGACEGEWSAQRWEVR